VLRKYWLWGLAVLAGALAALTWLYRDDVAYARIATGYAAKQTCSCLHVSGRSLDSCLADFPAEARERLTVSAEGQQVTASVLLGAISARAEYQGEYGCALTN
jgi:uncharacterized membrane protein